MKAVAGLGALLLAGCASTGYTPYLPPGSHYAALGSSYAAGAGIPPLATDRPARCGASQVSYSRLLAARLNLRLSDASCGGATTAHLLGPWNELPAQVDAVTPETRLVTLTVGGNDLNYMGLMFAASCHAGAAVPPAGGCADLPVIDDAAFPALEDRLVSIVAAIRSRAPRARVVLVQYVALTGEAPCASAKLLPEHAALARSVATRLAEASARAAERGGAETLPIDRLSQEHLPCSEQPWSRGLEPGYDGLEGAPWHPTAAGHAAIADELAGLLSG
jgi:lysophospholipase L1-like esterase